jgi:hypothetical protein
MKNRFRLFGHVERKHVDYVVRKIDEIENNHITRDIRRPRKIIRKTIRNDL